jgi:hypothetical protein
LNLDKSADLGPLPHAATIKVDERRLRDDDVYGELDAIGDRHDEPREKGLANDAIAWN